MEAAVTQEKAERTEGRLAFEWRRLKTGLCWVIFGLGGLGLSMTYFPYLRLTVGDPVARRLKARAMIARSFDFFARTMNRLAVMTVARTDALPQGNDHHRQPSDDSRLRPHGLDAPRDGLSREGLAQA